MPNILSSVVGLHDFNFGGFRHCGSEYKTFSICLKDHVLKGLRDFMEDVALQVHVIKLSFVKALFPKFGGHSRWGSEGVT